MHMHSLSYRRTPIAHWNCRLGTKTAKSLSAWAHQYAHTLYIINKHKITRGSIAGSGSRQTVSGQRRGDVLRMTWTDVDQGIVQVVQEKTGKRAWIPLHRDLRAELTSAER
jgi:integrase